MEKKSSGPRSLTKGVRKVKAMDCVGEGALILGTPVGVKAGKGRS